MMDGLLNIIDTGDLFIHKHSFVLDSMRMSAVEGRLSAILERDWKEEATKLLEQRKISGEGDVSVGFFFYLHSEELSITIPSYSQFNSGGNSVYMLSSWAQI